MRVPAQLLLVLFAFLATIDAYIIPEGGKYPSFVAKVFCRLTAVLLTGDKPRKGVGVHNFGRLSQTY